MGTAGVRRQLWGTVWKEVGASRVAVVGSQWACLEHLGGQHGTEQSKNLNTSPSTRVLWKVILEGDLGQVREGVRAACSGPQPQAIRGRVRRAEGADRGLGASSLRTCPLPLHATPRIPDLRSHPLT